LTALKIAAVAPMPMPTVAMIVAVNNGTRSRLRMPMRRSCTIDPGVTFA